MCRANRCLFRPLGFSLQNPHEACGVPHVGPWSSSSSDSSVRRGTGFGLALVVDGGEPPGLCPLSRTSGGETKGTGLGLGAAASDLVAGASGGEAKGAGLGLTASIGLGLGASASAFVVAGVTPSTLSVAGGQLAVAI